MTTLRNMSITKGIQGERPFVYPIFVTLTTGRAEQPCAERHTFSHTLEEMEALCASYPGLFSGLSPGLCLFAAGRCSGVHQHEGYGGGIPRVGRWEVYPGWCIYPGSREAYWAMYTRIYTPGRHTGLCTPYHTHPGRHTGLCTPYGTPTQGSILGYVHPVVYPPCYTGLCTPCGIPTMYTLGTPLGERGASAQRGVCSP